MNGDVLLDTNIIIALFDGEPTAVEAAKASAALFLCVPVLGELRYGALASTRVDENLARLDQFSRAVKVLPCTTDTALFYSDVKLGLRKKGRPIPENDVWIAAIARQHGLTLLTRDIHFNEVENLSLALL
jgi:tRNA(fMet)-specific endonuclease VapC